MFRSLNGAYSYALGDYYGVNATKSLDSLTFYEFSEYVDPFCNLFTNVHFILKV